MNIILTFSIKELKLLFRNPTGLIMLFILPAIFILVLSVSLQGAFSSASSREKMNLLIVNEDKGDAGQNLIEGLNKIGYFNIIQSLNNKKLTLEDTKKLLNAGKYKIAIHIPENTTEAVNFKSEESISIYVDPVLSSEFASNITNAIQTYVNATLIKNIASISSNVFSDISKKRAAEIDSQITETTKKKNEITKQWNDIKNAQVDENSKAIMEKLTLDNIKDLSDKIQEFKNQKESFAKSNNSNEELLKNKYDISDAKVGLKVNQVYYSAGRKDIIPNSVQQNVPGWTIFALYWIVQLLAMYFIAEKQNGVFKRILIAPIRKTDYIIGKIIPFFLINILQAIMMFMIGIFILPLFGCPKLVINNVFELSIMTAAISINAISMGLLLASVSNSVTFAASVSALLIIIMTVIGGIMVPKFVMPVFMQKMSYFVPQGWALDGYLNILMKNYNIIQILPNIIALLAFSAVFFFIASIFLWKISKNTND